MEKKLEIGTVVYSKAGRDQGRCFVVVGVEPEYVYLADGCLRKIAKPKKKKIKHVKPKPIKAENISAEMLSKNKVLDSDIRKSLMSMGYGIKKEG